jgi:hypothetical protein
MKAVFALCLAILCGVAMAHQDTQELYHIRQVTFNDKALNVSVGHVIVSIPEGTFRADGVNSTYILESRPYGIRTFSSEQSEPSDDGNDYYYKRSGMRVRSHSPDCPYDWMTYCHTGSGFNLWPVDGAPLVFAKNITVYYKPALQIRSSGEPWYGIETTQDLVYIGSIPSRVVEIDGAFWVAIVTDHASYYTAELLAYADRTLSDCSPCVTSLAQCADHMAMRANKTNICELSRSEWSYACSRFQEVHGCDSYLADCYKFCKQGAIEQSLNPVLDFWCQESTSHTYIAEKTCHYHRTC